MIIDRDAQRLWEPAGSGKELLGTKGQLRLLELIDGRTMTALGLIDGREDVGAVDPVEVSFGGRRIPAGHVELERVGNGVGMAEARQARVLALALYGINGVGGDQRQEREQLVA